MVGQQHLLPSRTGIRSPTSSITGSIERRQKSRRIHYGITRETHTSSITGSIERRQKSRRIHYGITRETHIYVYRFTHIVYCVSRIFFSALQAYRQWCFTHIMFANVTSLGNGPQQKRDLNPNKIFLSFLKSAGCYQGELSHLRIEKGKNPSPIQAKVIMIFRRLHNYHEKSLTYPPLVNIPFDGKMIRNPTVRIFTKAEENYSLTVRDGAIVLAPLNPRDELQHWYKDFRWGNQAKDEEGLPAFVLVNKATGLAIKHSLGPTHPVRLIPFNPEYLDESILWTESHDTGEGFRCIRMVNNIRLNFDAFHGDKDHGGVHDGTTVVLWEWFKGKNQRWKIAPYY